MWTWIGGPTSANSYGSIGTRGVESTNNKLVAVEGCGLFAEENPLRLYTFGGYGFANSVTSGMTSRLYG